MKEVGGDTGHAINTVARVCCCYLKPPILQVPNVRLVQILGHMLLDAEACRACPGLLVPPGPAEAAYQTGLALLAAHASDARLCLESDAEALLALKEEFELARAALGERGGGFEEGGCYS